jgi:putative endonuclease
LLSAVSDGSDDAAPSDTTASGTTGDDAGDHFVYVLRCADDTLYTGYTTDVRRRVREHDAGEGAKYTRGRTPVELVHVEAFDSRSAAMSREYAIKQLSRAEKERLVAGEDG